jgi:tetratricopeptide (TPR) repeat protein
VAGEDADLAWLRDPTAREALRRDAHRALIDAGRVARRRFAIARAVELHEQALALSSSDEERLDAYEQLGQDHYAAFHGDEAYAALQEALSIARSDPRNRSRVALIARRAATLVATRGGAFRGQPDLAQVEALIEEGLAAADDARGWGPGGR